MSFTPYYEVVFVPAVRFWSDGNILLPYHTGCFEQVHSTHVCMYACLSVFVSVCLSVHVCMYVCTYAGMYVCVWMHAFEHVCINVCMDESVCVCMYGCMHAGMYACTICIKVTCM